MGDIVIGYDLHGSVAVITIDRPPVNAYDAALERDLAAAWRRAADDPAAAVVVLRAEGPHFCAGVDVAGTSPAFGAGSGAFCITPCFMASVAPARVLPR